MTYEHWVIATATIGDCNWEDAPPWAQGNLFVGQFTVGFTYVVKGAHYRGKFYSSHAWGRGAEVGMLYNPENPKESCICDDD